MAENGTRIVYDLKAKTATVVCTFDTDDNVQKKGLEANVISHHLMMLASTAIAAAAEATLQGVTDIRLDDEEAKAMAEQKAAFAKRRAAAGTKIGGNVDDVLAVFTKAEEAAGIANAAAKEEAERDVKVATEAKRLADEATAKAIAELTTPMEVVP